MATATLQPTAIHNQPNPTQSSLSSTNNDSEHIPTGPVTAQLNFYSPPPDNAKPFNYVEAPPAGQPQRNYHEAVESVQINDLRGHEDEFTLDNNAFATLSGIPSQMRNEDFDSDEKVREVYYPEVERLILENVPGAHRVLLFDHTIRRANPNAHRAPVTRVHIDQTPASAAQRVKHHLPDEADQLLSGRYRIINIWRPLNGPVVSFPLAVADSATVRDEDLVGIEHRYPDRTGETAGVRYNEGQKWWYWSGMGNEERLLLKCFDSDESVGGWGRVPHTAFVDPRTREGARGRESIEVRALVFG